MKELWEYPIPIGKNYFFTTEIDEEKNLFVIKLNNTQKDSGLIKVGMLEKKGSEFSAKPNIFAITNNLTDGSYILYAQKKEPIA